MRLYISRITILLLAVITLALTGCSLKPDEADEKSEGVMTYAEYCAAPFDSEVVVETYVQATEAWMDNNIRVYTEDHDGAYYIYSLNCTKQEANKLTPGTKIKVTGRKTVWAKQIEIVDATFTIEDGKYIAEAEDVSSVLGSDELINAQNKKAAVKGVVIVDSGDGLAYTYGEDNSGVLGDDLYFKGELNDDIFLFKVESNMYGTDTDVYKAVEALKVGDRVDMEVFLCWNENILPFVTAITVSE